MKKFLLKHYVYANLQNMLSTTNRFWLVVAIMSATLIQVLDTTIVNVALPHMKGSLSATPDSISWALTSYLVASAIVMPLTGYFSDKLGRKNHLLWCIFGFTITSALCGLSVSLMQIVVYRLLQGVFGAGLVPLSQAIIADAYSKKDLGKAMAIWGSGVMIGPILGPILGGYLTEFASWRWTFYINIPIGTMAFILAWKFVPNTIIKKRSFDWLGFIFIATTIGATQFLLDRGNHDDWFNSISMRISAILAISSLLAFLAYTCFYNSKEQKIFDPGVFKDRNFVISITLMLIMGIGMFGSMVMLPILLQNLLNYPVLLAGIMLTPRALGAVISMSIMGKICGIVDPRKLIATGIIFSAIGTYFFTYYCLEISTWWLIWPSILQGLGMGMIMLPLGTIAYATLPLHLRAEAAGLNSLMRTVGGSMGIAVTLTIFTRSTQGAWNKLITFIDPYSPNIVEYLHHANLDLNKLENSAALLAGEVQKQAAMMAMIDVFVFIVGSFIVILPLVLLLKRQDKHSP